MDIPPLASAGRTTSPSQGWFSAWSPAFLRLSKSNKARWDIRGRLFSKNLFGSQDLWASWTSTWTSTCILACFVALAIYLCYHALHSMVASGSSRQTKDLWSLSEMLSEDTHVSQLENELDSDEYEEEHERPRPQGFVAGIRERQALRRMLGRSDPGLTKKSSIIRITSSDPTSDLCDNPIQIQLDATGRRLFWPNNPSSSHSAPADTDAPPATTKRVSSLSGSPVPSRRRRESGRLIGASSRGVSSSPSPSRSPLSATSTPTRPARSRPVELKVLPRMGPNTSNTEGRANSALSSSPIISMDNVQDPAEDAWADEAVEDLPADDVDEKSIRYTPSMASEASFVSASSGCRLEPKGSSNGVASSPFSSPASSTLSLPRLPSILKRQQQTFRTASLKEIDISFSLQQRNASLPNGSPAIESPISPIMNNTPFGMMPNAFFPPNSAFPLTLNGVAPPPYSSAASSSIGSNSPAVLSPPWRSHQRERKIKLVEPDWEPHVDDHIRARERMEAATRFARFKRSNSVDTHLADLANRVESKCIDVDDGPDQDFWFERYTQSTAAAGRDWDWRKRRARLQRAAALGAALDQSGLGMQHVAQLASNVGSTDVQGYQDEIGSNPTVAATDAGLQRAASPRRAMPAAPLITFTEKELQSTPNLKIDTETGRLVPLDPTKEEPMSPTPSGTGTPLGGIFNAVIPSAMAVGAAVMAQRRRASEDLSRPSPLNMTTKNVGGASSDSASPSSAPPRPALPSESSSSSLKKTVNRVTRRKQSSSQGSSGAESLPMVGSVSSILASMPRSSMSTDDFGAYSQSEVSPMSSHVATMEAERGSGPSSPSIPSPPGRLSSLSKGRKVSLTNLRAGLRRGSSSNDFLQDGAGMDLVGSRTDGNDADLREEAEAQQRAYEESLMGGGRPSLDAFRSSADAYHSPSQTPPTLDGDPPHQSHSRVEHVGSSPLRHPRQHDGLPSAHFDGGSTLNKLASAPAGSASPKRDPRIDTLSQHSSLLTPNRKRQDSEQGSISQGSTNSSDSLRRRLRSQTDPDVGMVAVQMSPSSSLNRVNASTGERQDALAALAGSTSSSLPVSKTRAKSGSRSSIMRSASGAQSAMDRTARTRGTGRASTGSIGTGSNSSISSAPGSRNGSIRRLSPSNSMKRIRPEVVMSSERDRETAPDPMLQPEPAPRGMAYRARSASLSSNASSPTSSRRSSRSNSFREGHGPSHAGAGSGLVGLSTLTMTATASGTSGTPEERRSDPLISMTPLRATDDTKQTGDGVTVAVADDLKDRSLRMQAEASVLGLTDDDSVNSSRR